MIEMEGGVGRVDGEMGRWANRGRYKVYFEILLWGRRDNSDVGKGVRGFSLGV